MSFIEVKNMYKRYKTGETTIEANKDVSFNIERNEFTVIVGPSGAGKSTVLNILGGLDLPSDGQVIVDGNDISQYNTQQLTDYRRYEIGFVFQFYNLIPNLTAKENVEMATQIVDNAFDSEEVLKSVGLGKRIDNFPSQLSGGEQQRVAIARAVAKKPKILLCDEPTGALDGETGKKVLKILHQMSREQDVTVIVITHNEEIIPMADRMIVIRDGKINKNIVNENPKSVEELDL